MRFSSDNSSPEKEFHNFPSPFNAPSQTHRYMEEEYEYNLAQPKANPTKKSALTTRETTGYCTFSPAINHYYGDSATKRGLQGRVKPEERLLMAGEKYKEKLRKMQLEEFQRRKEEEERILEEGKSIYKNRHERKDDMNDIPVEERLQLYLEKYKHRQQERINDIQKEELSLLRKPSINPTSEKIVSNMSRIAKVEDRLIFSGKKTKLILDEKTKQAEFEAKTQASPFISNALNRETNSAQKDVVDRLYNYKKLYEGRKVERERQIYQENCTFAPYINPITKQIASERKSIVRPKSGLKSYETPECTFHPRLNPKSTLIAQYLGPSEERLLKLKETSKVSNEKEPNFAPNVNQLSAKIDRKKKEKFKGNTSRWELLYELGERQREEFEIKQREKLEKEEREVEKYSFQPLLTSEENIRTVPRSSSVEKRSMQWAKMRSDKIQALANMEKDKELEGCTFYPVLYKPEKKSHNKSYMDCEANETVALSLKSIAKYIQKQKKMRENRQETTCPMKTVKRPPAKSVSEYKKTPDRSYAEVDDEQFKSAIRDMHNELLSISITNPNF